MNKKIIPHLWFDKKALEAVDFYVDLFEDSIILNESELRNTPSGDVQMVEFEIAGTQFQAINGGPYFEFNNAVSLMIYCKSEDEAKKYWNFLKEDAVILNELALDENKQIYGSLKDKFNLVWQLITVNGSITQKIIPSLLFSGKAQEAMIYYGQVFPHSVIKFVDQRKDASLIFAHYKIEDLEFISMDVKEVNNPGFNESISFMVMCDDQREIDFYTDILSADPKAEQCGWIKDKYELSWQIIPKRMTEMLKFGSQQQIDAVTESFLSMKKLDIQELEDVYENYE